jgi:glycosyltransferase involved in cell wall biosynthesis
MDGLAAGRPVISNAPGQAARLLAESGCGIAVPPGDAAGLAAALMSLVENPARREAMGQAARGLAVRRYDRRLLAARFVGLVESIAQEQASLAHSRPLTISGKG